MQPSIRPLAACIIREEKLLQKYLPHDGKYKDVTYDIRWKNFTSGAPITNEQIAGKLDFAVMADFPGSLNGVAHEKAGRKSIFISAVMGSVKGSGNGIVVPPTHPSSRLPNLKAKQSPFHLRRPPTDSAASDQGPRLDTRQGRKHHYSSSRSRRARITGKPDRSARRLRTLRGTLSVARLCSQDL